MMINVKTHYETNMDPLPGEFVASLKEMFEDMARHSISKKLRPSEKTKSKWNLTSPGDYELGRMICAWHNFGIREFSAKYNRGITNHQEIEIMQLVEESIVELREYFKTLD